MTRSKIRTSGAEGLTLSSTSLTIANGLTLTDGDIALASGHGLNFASTSDAGGMSSELLDDYEEGTYDVTFTPSSSGSITMRSDYNTGSYIRVGKLVHVGFYAVISSISSPTGYISINLPLAVEQGSEGAYSSAFYVHAGGLTGLNIANVGGSLAVNNTSEVRLYGIDSTTLQADSAQALTSSSYMYGAGTYRTSA